MRIAIIVRIANIIYMCMHLSTDCAHIRMCEYRKAGEMNGSGLKHMNVNTNVNTVPGECLHVCVHTSISHMYICIYKHVHIYICILYTRVHTYTYTLIHMYIYIYMYTCVCMYTYIYMYTCGTIQQP